MIIKDTQDQKTGLLLSMLTDLNDQMHASQISASIDVVGGFALMAHGLRDRNSYTDVDYVGDTLPNEIARMTVEIGNKYGVEEHWLNNDIMLSGSSLEDLEMSTGKLHFSKTIDFGNLKVNVLDQPDLLRLKVIALDTSLTAVESGGDFTRLKDLYDIAALMKELDYDTHSIKELFSDYIINPATPDFISVFMDRGKTAVMDYISDVQQKANTPPDVDVPHNEVDWDALGRLGVKSLSALWHSQKEDAMEVLSQTPTLDQKIAKAKNICSVPAPRIINTTEKDIVGIDDFFDNLGDADI